MASFRYDPYLWIHLAGAATVPLWLAICGLGLAVGYSTHPGFELGVMVLLGVVPTLLMQLVRPFYIFSLPGLVLRPSALSEDQRRLLTLFRQRWVRLMAVLVPWPLVWVVMQLYPVAVVASDITPFTPWGRWGGLAVAMGSLWMANLFLQVPLSVLFILATSEARFQATVPYGVDQVLSNFTQVGLSLPRILPMVIPPGAEHLLVTVGPMANSTAEILADPALEAEVYHHVSSDLPEPIQTMVPPLKPEPLDNEALENEVSVVRLTESD